MDDIFKMVADSLKSNAPLIMRSCRALRPLKQDEHLEYSSEGVLAYKYTDTLSTVTLDNLIDDSNFNIDVWMELFCSGASCINRVYVACYVKPFGKDLDFSRLENRLISELRPHFSRERCLKK